MFVCLKTNKCLGKERIYRQFLDWIELRILIINWLLSSINFSPDIDQLYVVFICIGYVLYKYPMHWKEVILDNKISSQIV